MARDARPAELALGSEGRVALTLAAALVRRLLSGAATLLVVTWIVFALIHAAPGDAASGADGFDTAGPALSPEHVAALRAIYHLDEPLVRQYWYWLRDAASGSLGHSFQDERPVAEKIAARLPVTFALNVASLIVMLSISVPLGAAAAWKRGTSWDRLGGVATYALYAVPVFWAALLLQLLFAVRLGWLPLYGLSGNGLADAPFAAQALDRAAHFVLPVVCLSYGGLAYLSRFVRASLLEGAFDEAARAARARGATPPWLIFRHGLRQASIPLLTLAGFLVPALFGGAVIVETVFAIPGIGRLFFESVMQHDLPVLLGLTLLSGAATLAGVVLADVAVLLADPRAARRAAVN